MIRKNYMISEKPYICVVITAGGSGTRYNKDIKKQFTYIGKKRILDWTILAFYNHELIDEIILTVPEDDLLYCLKMFKKYKDKMKIVSGSNSRQESVFNGLKQCPSKTDIVLIHDGVRPFIKPSEITSLIKLAISKNAVVPVTPIKNTIKKVNNMYIETTINRDEYYEVHTPQVFNYHMIVDCHNKAHSQNKKFTDDAGICEFYKIPVYTLEISHFNIKITNPDDRTFASAILKEFKKEVNYG